MSAARAFRLNLATLLGAFLACAVFLVPSACADARIGESASDGAAGTLERPAGLAVSAREGGDLYVLDQGGNQRVDQFEPDGTFVRAFGWGVRDGAPELETCTTATGCQANFDSNHEPLYAGSGPGEFRYSDEIAVDNDPSSASYGDVYVVDQRNYRVEKFSPAGQFLLMFGGEVDKTTHANLCTAADIAGGDTCGKGVPGSGPGEFYDSNPAEFNPTGEWWNTGHNSIAVGPDGTIYVGDYQRVQEFEPNGTYAGQLSLPDGHFVGALAVDAAGDIFERSANYQQGGATLVGQVPGVREYSPAHVLLRTFDAGAEEAGSEPTHVALGEGGELLVSDFDGGNFRFRAFKPTGALYAEFGSDQVAVELNRGTVVGAPNGIAVAAGKLYATSSSPGGGHVAVVPLPEPGPPVVSGLQATDVEPKTATLHGVVNPEQFETKYRFEWITDSNFKADGDTFGAGTAHTELQDLGAISREDPVQTAISDLLPGTVYHWRLVAESSAGTAAPEGEFVTLPNVSIRDFTTQTVAPELVTLKAELDPNNGGSTHYAICYGTEAGHYTAACAEGTLKGLGSEFENVSATFTGLQPDTAYHYQLVASNSNGKTETGDGIFTTELSAAEERALEDCPNGTTHGTTTNSTLREENNSLALADCRAYEQVSPTFKNGYPVLPGGELSPSGEGAGFQSLGSFAGATAIEGLGTEFVAHRTPDGWSTQSVGAFPAGPDQQPTGFIEFDAEMDSWLTKIGPGANFSSALVTRQGTIYEHQFGGGVFPVSPTFHILEGEPTLNWYEPVGASTDFSRLYIGTEQRLVPAPGDLRPGPLHAVNGTSSPDRIYVVDGADSSPALVAEVPTDLTERESCTLDNSKGISKPRWTTADAATLFYTAPLDTVAGARCEAGEAFSEGPNKAAVFARTGSASPVQISAEFSPLCHSPSPCAGAPPAQALFDGTSPEGRFAWFTTPQPLVDSDLDRGAANQACGSLSHLTTAGCDLYLAKLQGGQVSELVQASRGDATDPSRGEGADVQGVVQVSSDGTHVAFIATGLLTAEPNQLGDSAAVGADNLYVYDALSGQTRFVTRLCSGPGRSGSAADPSCPASLSASSSPGAENDLALALASANNAGPEYDFTPEGRYLLFAAYGQLASGDTDEAPDVYRFDFEAASLVRVSGGRDGNDGNGNDNLFPATLERGVALRHITGNDEFAGDVQRSISSDGSTVIFETAAPLVSADTDHALDVYEWEEQGHGSCSQAGGCISLVSSGLDPHGSQHGLISASGRDIIFYTSRGLVPGDTDGAGDIYDARVEGGFHATHPAPPCGAPEACHGSSPPFPPPPQMSSAGQTGGNGPQQLHCAKGKVRVKKHGQVRCVAKKHHRHHGYHRRRHGHRRGGV